MIKNFIITETDAGKRLDKFLAEQMPEFSRNEIQKFAVRNTKYETRNAKFSDKIKSGDEYVVDVPDVDERVSHIESRVSFLLEILHEDDDIIVVNKPRGIVMYPAAGNFDGTLVQNVLAHTTLSTLGGAMRPGVVHRLDKDTSGVVVLAKSDAAHRALTKMFSEHDLVRKYIAFVWGVPNWESADITGNIARSSRNRQKMSMVKTGGKEAHTEVEVMEIWGREKISQIRCTLHTGRTHQIRVHLSSHGFPVLCDPVYGRGATRLGSVKNMELLDFLREHHGQMLHASILEFNHPITGTPLKFKTKLPADMAELKEILDF
jgi:23S rRNA pseudouridine1911/1915/1917 synthase